MKLLIYIYSLQCNFISFKYSIVILEELRASNVYMLSLSGLYELLWKV